MKRKVTVALVCCLDALVTCEVGSSKVESNPPVTAIDLIRRQKNIEKLMQKLGNQLIISLRANGFLRGNVLRVLRDHKMSIARNLLH